MHIQKGIGQKSHLQSIDADMRKERCLVKANIQDNLTSTQKLMPLDQVVL